MKGYISIDIPTKRYIKAYVFSKLGPKPIMSPDTLIGSKLYDVLSHKTNERKKQFANVRYNTTMRVYVNFYNFNHRGGILNETNIKNFNLFIEREIKATYRMYLDFYFETLPSFEANLPQVRKNLGIDIDDWSDDSIKKDYYRYRLRTGKPLLYKDNYDRVVVSPRDHDPAF